MSEPGPTATIHPPDLRGAAVDEFLSTFFRLHPVTATFAGAGGHDHVLPDYSPEGLATAAAERARLRRMLTEVGLGIATPAELAGPDWTAIDGMLADATLEIELAESDSRHFLHRNPALGIADALYGLVSLASPDAADVTAAVESSIARLRAFPSFLDGARRSIGNAAVPAAWRERTMRTCDGGLNLLADLAGWPVARGAPVTLCRAFQEAATHASAAVDWYRAWVATCPDAPVDRYAAGESFLDLVIRRAHGCDRPVEALRHEARASLEREVNRLSDLLREDVAGSWDGVLERMMAHHPPVEAVLETCEAAWRDVATASAGQVTWPGIPMRFVPLPTWARRAAPELAWRLYRSPAPLALPAADRYHVPLPDDASDGASRDRFSRAWNHAAIRLQHVMHHGGLGRHALYWQSARSPSRIARVAAVDGASRLAMLVGGTMVEGWAAYAIEMMEEEGLLTPDERLAAQRERVHVMVRAVVDLELHTGLLPFDHAVTFHHEVAMVSEAAARAEVTRCSMFPGTGVMRWLGLRELWRARHAAESRQRDQFSPIAFHDSVLHCGALPVPLVSRLVRLAPA